jgi:hypothetical protein
VSPKHSGIIYYHPSRRAPRAPPAVDSPKQLFPPRSDN